MNAWNDLAAMKVLIVDDEQANVALLQYILGAAGYTNLRATSDARKTMALFHEFQPDLILLDLMMPFVSGFEIMEKLSRVIAADDCLPILVLTADVNTESKHQALLAGASDFLTKPFDQIEVLLRIRHLLQFRAQHRQLAGQNDRLEEAVRDRTGELRTALGQLEETLHQLRSTQQQVIQHERLSALGAMAAGLAHDFNNSLSLILGYSELLQTDLISVNFGARADEFLEVIITAAQDAAKLFSRLRSIYRAADQEQEWALVALNDLVEQAVALTRPRWHGQALGQGATIALRTDLDPSLPTMVADPSELREMLTNLIFNAVDAMPEGGTLTVRTRFEPAPGRASDVTSAAGAGTVILAVSDTGTGMSEETRQRCLEPFFTTKGQKGTGLGLAMVYGTMQRHDAEIDLQSAPGRGTTFTFRLPLRVELAALPAKSEEVAAPPPLRVLVVDDQPVFVNILRHYLANDLHSVKSAGDGLEALRILRTRRFDLVITDQAMPNLSGSDLARKIKTLSPSTRVILLTGYADDSQVAGVESGIDAIVMKPVTHAKLRAVIARAMTGYRRPPSSPRRSRPKKAGVLPALGLRQIKI